MHSDSTIDELLGEPIIRKLMARDGVRAEEIRSLLEEARTRGRSFGTHSPVPMQLPSPREISLMG